MSISNFTAIIIAALGFIYAILYRKNRIIGNIFFFGLGMFILYSLGNAYPNSVESGLAYIFIFGSIISFIYDILKDSGGTRIS